MKKIILLFVVSFLGCNSQNANSRVMKVEDADILGDWKGSLNVSTTQLSIVFHFAEGEQGNILCLMDSPDQGAFGLKADSVLVKGDKFLVTMKSLSLRYLFSVNGKNIEGDFLQRGQKFALKLSPGNIVVNRPQTPVDSSGYNTREISFETGDATLAGTLSWPVGKGPFPVVVMLTGSGAQTRDEEIFSHKPFAVIADFLAKNGIASLRMDDRGVGGSDGNLAETSYDVLVRDAALMYGFVSAQPEFSTGSIGFLGHSEGGAIAPLVAAASTANLALPLKLDSLIDTKAAALPVKWPERLGDFLVLLAPVASGGRELLLQQTEAIMQKSGSNNTQIALTKKINKELYDIVFEFGTAAEFEKKVDAYFKKYAITGDNLKSQKSQVLSKPYVDLVRYQPEPVFAKIDIPVLAFFGGLDVQVPEDPNAGNMRSMLGGKNGKNLVVVMDQANHMFQPAVTGEVSEYSIIEQTIMPEVLSEIADWLDKDPGS